MNDIFSIAFITKFIKFGVVGVSGTIIDFGMTWLLKEKAKINKYGANGIAYMCGATSNFLLNRWWTFNSQAPEVWEQYGKFLGVSLVGLGLNTLIIYLLVTRLKMNFYVSKIGATLMVLVWNFFGNLMFTF
ncbi:MAG: GtrA family protein [Sphingobacteriales bacterium JAD_PAG50586_3]|nr:MAG: GtrA family protein [Sphingobacteriales bacterium JAD_PAG50586_3]